MALPPPPPGKAFDNLYFVGSKWVSAWAVTTSDGIVLIDAMDNDDEAERIVEAGLRRLGLDPAQVKLVVVTHGHGDHYGGAGYLTRRYGARVVMSEADWTMMETGLEFDRPDWGRPPRRDLSVGDGGTVRLGDTTLDVLITPGHTPGTITPLFDVRQAGRTHRAMLWGGTAFNFGRRPDRLQRLQAYIDATVRARDIAGRRPSTCFSRTTTATTRRSRSWNGCGAGAAIRLSSASARRSARSPSCTNAPGRPPGRPWRPGPPER
jgi:metallo-beta-lactamase class B